MTWPTAREVLNGMGYKQATKRMQALFEKAWGGKNGPVSDFEIDTHPRSYDSFAEAVKRNKPTHRTRRGLTWWFDYSGNEWTSVYLMFGSEDQVCTRLQEVIDKNEKDRLAREVIVAKTSPCQSVGWHRMCEDWREAQRLLRGYKPGISNINIGRYHISWGYLDMAPLLPYAKKFGFMIGCGHAMFTEVFWDNKQLRSGTLKNVKITLWRDNGSGRLLIWHSDNPTGEELARAIRATYEAAFRWGSAATDYSTANIPEQNLQKARQFVQDVVQQKIEAWSSTRKWKI
jgi:hypothetical protein